MPAPYTGRPIVNLPGLLLLGAALLLFSVNSYLMWGWELDDALIYARYLDNFISGNGLVYNPGEPVNGLTSPLFAYLAIPLAWLTGDARDAVMLVSSSAVAGSLLVFYALLVRFFVAGSAAAVGAALAALAAVTYINLGMEASLFVLVFAVCLYCYFAQAYRLLGVAVALLILTRPEGVLLVPALALNTYFQRLPWPPWQCYVTPTALMLLQLIFNGFYYGEFLQSSGVAKMHQGESGLWSQEHFLFRLLESFDYGFAVDGSWPVMAVLLVLAGCAGLVRHARQYLVVTLTFLLLYSGFFVIFSIPSQNWYYGIHFALLWSYVAIGAGGLLEKLDARWARCAYAGLLVALLGVAFWQEPRVLDTYRGTVRADYRAIGEWLAGNTPPRASIAMVEIGTVGWYSRREIVDILGLVTPGVSEFVATRQFAAWVDLYQPDYMLVHDPVWEMEAGLAVLEQRYQVSTVAEFDFPGFRLLQVTR
jgi:hypothetical protein